MRISEPSEDGNTRRSFENRKLSLNAPAAHKRCPLIVHVVRQFLPNRGGLEDVVYNLCRELQAKGHAVRVITLDSLFADPLERLPARETIDGIDIVRIPWKGSSRYPFAPSVFAHIRDADLVHVHAVDFFFDALSWLKILHGRPMIATTHGGFFHTKKHALIKTVWFDTMTRLSCRGYDRIACCSISDTLTFDRIARGRTLTIENGADLSKFAGRASAVPVRRAITIGRFSVNKRLERLIRAMAALVARDPSWHLDIVGVPSDLSAADVTALLAETGLLEHVTLHIGLANPEIADLIGQASLFASASDYEGFGLVAIEAMSAGLMPVLHENDAYRQLAARHDAIVLTDFTAPDEAADAMEAAHSRVVAGGASLRAALIAETRPYSWASVSDAYLSAYREAVPTLAPATG